MKAAWAVALVWRSGRASRGGSQPEKEEESV